MHRIGADMTLAENPSGRPSPRPHLAASVDGAEADSTALRVEGAVRDALARHLLASRPSADVAHVLLAGITVLVFWDRLPPWASLTWLGLFVATAAARGVNRGRVLARGLDTGGMLALVRRDVWLAASLWGGWALLQSGSEVESLLFLLLIFAGLVAAGTSTLVADARAFLGFMVLLFGPLAVRVFLSGSSREHALILLLMALFAPFMVLVQRRAHELLAAQVRGREHLRISEEKAGARRDFLDALVTSAPSSIVVLDERDRIASVNPAFERSLGYAAARASGTAFLDLVTTGRERPALGTFLETVREGRVAVADLPLRSSDGRDCWMRLAGTLVRGGGEGTALILGEDVTQQVAAREAQMLARIQAEEAARAKSAFLASMSHEIRTPMNGILGMVEILLDTPLTPDQRHTAEVIRSSGHGLLRILNDVLDVSKIEAGQLDLEIVAFDLHDALAQVGRVFAGSASTAGNELAIDVGEGVPQVVRGDPHRLGQILTNLVGNAVKFTRGGEVVLSAGHVGAAEGRQRVRFSVRDTGIGIPPEKHAAIFNAFEQADSSTTRIHGGTGLGLSIAKRLVELMGGQLEVESAPGEGSDFHFVLSLEVASEIRREDTRRAPPVRLADHRFLVVDDNATARRIVREALARVGVEVAEAVSVDDGLRVARQAAAAGEGFDVVILDQMMPGRDGFDFIQESAGDAALGSPKILMVTSAALPGGADRARDLGAGGYLPKPVARNELLDALAALLRGGASGGPERRLVTRETIRRRTGRARILLAEDNLVNAQVAVSLLTKRGHDVTAVTNGREAVEAAQRDRFDLVLMDIQMPEMDGLEATRRIRRFADSAALPVIALTAHAFAEERERSRAAGMNDFLAKPFRPDDLFELVERWAAPTTTPGSGPSMDKPTTAPGIDDVVPVDLAGFRAMMADAGVEEIVDTTLVIYLEESPRVFASLESAVRSRDVEGVRRAAHSLKSSSANIRANRLAGLLQAMEHLGQAGDAVGAGAALPELSAEFAAVVAQVKDSMG